MYIPLTTHDNRTMYFNFDKIVCFSSEEFPDGERLTVLEIEKAGTALVKETPEEIFCTLKGEQEK